jgi:CHAT domain-containing protein
MDKVVRGLWSESSHGKGYDKMARLLCAIVFTALVPLVGFLSQAPSASADENTTLSQREKQADPVGQLREEVRGLRTIGLRWKKEEVLPKLRSISRTIQMLTPDRQGRHNVHAVFGRSEIRDLLDKADDPELSRAVLATLTSMEEHLEFGDQDPVAADHFVLVAAYVLVLGDHESYRGHVDRALTLISDITASQPNSRGPGREIRWLYNLLLPLYALALYTNDDETKTKLGEALDRLSDFPGLEELSRFEQRVQRSAITLILADNSDSTLAIDKLIIEWGHNFSRLKKDGLANQDAEFFLASLRKLSMLAVAVKRNEIALRLMQAIGEYPVSAMTPIMTARAIIHRERLASCGIDAADPKLRWPTLDGLAEKPIQQALWLLTALRFRIQADQLLEANRPSEALLSLQESRRLVGLVGWQALSDNDRSELGNVLPNVEVLGDQMVSPGALGARGVLAALDMDSGSLRDWAEYWITAQTAPEDKIAAVRLFVRLVLARRTPSRSSLELAVELVELADEAGRTMGNAVYGVDGLENYWADIQAILGDWSGAITEAARPWWIVANESSSILKLWLSTDGLSMVTFDKYPSYIVPYSNTDPNPVRGALDASEYRVPLYVSPASRLEGLLRLLSTMPSGAVSPYAAKDLGALAFSLSSKLVTGDFDGILSINATMTDEHDPDVRRAAHDYAQKLASAIPVVSSQRRIAAQYGHSIQGILSDFSAKSWLTDTFEMEVGSPCAVGEWTRLAKLSSRTPITMTGRYRSTEYRDGSSRIPPPGSDADEVREAKEALSRAAAESGADAVRRWSSANSPIANGPQNSDIVRNLDDQDLLVQVSSVGRTVAVVATTRAGTQVANTMDLAEIRSLIDDLRAAVSRPPLKGAIQSLLPSAAYGLYAALIQPSLKGTQGIRRILVALGDDIADLPINALLTVPWQPERTLAAQAWIDKRYQVRQLAGLGVLFRRTTIQSDAAGLGFVGIGAPALMGNTECDRPPSETRDVPRLPTVSGVSALCPVPETLDMLERLARVANTDEKLLLVGPTATLKDIAGAAATIETARILAFATHGLQPDDVAALGYAPEPALVMTPTPTGEDGLLKASQIAALRLNADLVILAACGSGTRSTSAVKAWRGIGEAFLFGGARAVIVTGWSVDVDATNRLVGQIVRDPARLRTAPGESLRSAVQQFRDAAATTNQAEQQHPYYWAAFSLVGLGEYRVP